MSEDDVIFLNTGDDDDNTVYQTEKDKKRLARKILGHLDADDITETDTTLT